MFARKTILSFIVVICIFVTASCSHVDRVQYLEAVPIQAASRIWSDSSTSATDEVSAKASEAQVDAATRARERPKKN